MELCISPPQVTFRGTGMGPLPVTSIVPWDQSGGAAISWAPVVTTRISNQLNTQQWAEFLRRFADVDLTHGLGSAGYRHRRMTCV
jgi:hypothetical protein